MQPNRLVLECPIFSFAWEANNLHIWPSVLLYISVASVLVRKVIEKMRNTSYFLEKPKTSKYLQKYIQREEKRRKRGELDERNEKKYLGLQKT